MKGTTAAVGIIAALLATAFPHSAWAQVAPRRLSFAEAATAVIQSNLHLRAAAFDVAVARAQLDQNVAQAQLLLATGGTL